MTTLDPTPPKGQIFVLNDIGERERAALEAAGKVASDYCVILTPVVQMDMTVQTAQSGEAVMLLQSVVAVPVSILPLPTRGVLDASGNTAVASKSKEALPIAPYLHLVVARSALSEPVRADLDRSRVLRTLTGDL